MKIKSIRSKLMLFFIAFSVVSSIGIASIVHNVSAEIIKEKVEISTKDSLRQISNRVDTVILRFANYSYMLSWNKAVNYMLHYNTILPQDGSTYLSFLEVDKAVSPLVLEDANILSVALLPEKEGVYGFRGYFDEEKIRNTPWFEQVQKRQSGASVEGVQPSPDELKRETSAFVIGGKIKDLALYNTTQTLGHVVFFLDENYFIKYLESTKQEFNSYIIILDEQENIISSSLPGEYSLVKKELASLALQQEKDSVYTLGDQEMYIQSHRSVDTGFRVIRLIPYSFYTKDFNRLTLITVVLCLLMISIFVFLSVLVAQGISKPIKRLEQGMQKVGQGDFDANVPVRSEDEIGRITVGFNDMLRDLKALFEDTIEAEKGEREAQIKALQYQINPHFIYNALSSVSMYALLNNNSEISEMLNVLYRLLRNTLSQADGLITIEDELNNIEDYFKIQQIRYLNRIHVVYEIEDDLPYYIPNMILQPILENAISHGLLENINSYKKIENQIIIRIYKQDGIVLEVEDNGKGMTDEEIQAILHRETAANSYDSSTHIGVHNILKRIEFAYGKAYGITITSKKGEFTIVKIHLPAIEKREENE